MGTSTATPKMPCAWTMPSVVRHIGEVAVRKSVSIALRQALTRETSGVPSLREVSTSSIFQIGFSPYARVGVKPFRVRPEESRNRFFARS